MKRYFYLTICMQCSIYNYHPIKSPSNTVGCKSVSIVRVWTLFWSSVTSKNVFLLFQNKIAFFYHWKIYMYVICQYVYWHFIYCSITYQKVWWSLRWGRLCDPINRFNPPHVCAWPKEETAFPTPYDLLCFQWFEIVGNCSFCKYFWKKNLTIPKGGNQNTYIEEEQITQWAKDTKGR